MQHQSILMTSSLHCDPLPLRNSVICWSSSSQEKQCFIGTSVVDVLILALFLPNRDCGLLHCVTQVLAGLDSFRYILEYIRHGLGKVRLEQHFFPMDSRGLCLCTEDAPLRPKHCLWGKQGEPSNSTLLSGSSSLDFHFPRAIQGQYAEELWASPGSKQLVFQ